MDRGSGRDRGSDRDRLFRDRGSGRDRLFGIGDRLGIGCLGSGIVDRGSDLNRRALFRVDLCNHALQMCAFLCFDLQTLICIFL